MGRIRLTETQLHNVIRRCVCETLNRSRMDEGWKEWMLAGAMGLSGANGAAARTAANNQPTNTTYNERFDAKKFNQFDFENDGLSYEGYIRLDDGDPQWLRRNEKW